MARRAHDHAEPKSVATTAKRVRVADVARVAGVSAMTVSNVINAPDRVSEQTLRTVRAAIDELGYTPNHAARALSSGRSNVIGLAIDTDEEPSRQTPGLGGFMHGLLPCLVDAAARQGYGVLVTSAVPESSETVLYERLMAARQVDAIVITQTTPNDPRIEFVSRRGFPFVAFGRTGKAQRQCWVDVDNENSMTAIAQHLLSTGRIHPVYLQTGGQLPWIHQRREGFLKQFTGAGIRPVSITEFDQLDDVADFVSATLDGPDRPDAFVADNDALAVMAIRALQRHGVTVGPDIAVTGFNDFPFAGLLDTPLTTARIPLDDIAARLFARAIQEIDEGPDDPGQLVLAPLVVRVSA